MVNLIFITIIYFLVFIFLSFFVFYSTGFALIKRTNEYLEDREIISLSFCLGIILFLFTAVIFGFLHLRFLVLPFLLLISILTLIKFQKQLFVPWKFFLKDRILSGLIFLGILVQGFINFPSGFLYKEGLLFWSAQGHDGLWHVALMEEIKNAFPPQNPVFSGHGLYNYHYLVDVVMGEFYRIFPFFSSLDLYFRFFPVIFSFLIGISVYAFVARWQNNKKIGYLALFFTYFVGSFGYVVTFIQNRIIFGGESVFWVTQLNTIIGNPPHAISISLLASFLLAFFFFIKKRNAYWFIVCFLLAITLAGFKVQAGLVLLFGLGCAAIVDFIFNRKLSIFLLSLVLGLTNFLTIKLMTKDVTSFLIFQPWWFIRTMVVAGNRLDWIDLEFRRQHYISKGTWHAYLRVFQLETTAFLIFLIGNLGIKLLGFIEIFKKIIFGKSAFYKNPLEILIFSSMLISFLIPLFFVQKGIAYNNIQFMQYFLLFFAFYAAIAVFQILSLLKIKLLKVIFILLVIIFSIPTVIGNFAEFYGPGRPPLAKITNSELEALNYLKKNSKPTDIILTKPFNKYANSLYKSQPWPIYAWYNTAYVFVFSGRYTYASDEDQLAITGYDNEQRLINAKLILGFSDTETDNFNGEKIKRLLKEEQISFVYLNKDEVEKKFQPEKEGLNVFFENKDAIIYKVEKS